MFHGVLEYRAWTTIENRRITRRDDPKGCSMYDCSPIPVFCFLYSKIFVGYKNEIKMRSKVCVNEMAPFGPFAPIVNG